MGQLVGELWIGCVPSHVFSYGGAPSRKYAGNHYEHKAILSKKVISPFKLACANFWKDLSALSKK